MFIKHKISLLFFFLLFSASLQAVILNMEEASKADLSSLQDEIELFKSISMGITLSIAHCEGVDACALPMEEKEVQQLIKTLEYRIDSLAARQSEIDDIIGFNKVLSTYISLRDSYSSYIERIQSIVLQSKNMGDQSQFDNDPDFPIGASIDEELLEYLNELSMFEDDELVDDEDSSNFEDLPQTGD